MSRFKLKVAIVAAACVLNAGLAIASSIWLYQHIYGHRSSSSNLGAGSAEYELDASHSDAESQDEDGGSGETTVSNPPDFSLTRAPMLDDESHRDDFYSEPEIGSLLAMTGSGAVDRPAFDADRRSLRSHPHQMVEAATHERATITDNNIRNSVDINNRPTVKFYFEPEGSYMIRMSLVAHASNDEQRGTAIVLRSLGQTGHALTVFSSYDPSTSEVAWTSYGLSIFLQGFVTLWAHDRHRRCQKLSVDLPTHQSEILTVTPLPMPLLPQYLEAVVWKGHHNQFNLFFSQQLPPSLKILILRCKVSLDDCERLLYSGRSSLRKFDVHYIGRSVEDVLQGQIESHASMDHLESISLVADWDIFRMFEYFHYPKLRELDITNSKPRLNFRKGQSEVRRYFANILRSELTSTRLHCAMTQDEKDWLDKFRGKDDVEYMTTDLSRSINFDHDDFPALPSTL